MSGSPWARVDEINGRASEFRGNANRCAGKAATVASGAVEGKRPDRNDTPPATDLLFVRVGKIAPERPVRMVRLKPGPTHQAHLCGSVGWALRVLASTIRTG